jgi:diacylglycerol kinase (ATP)
MRVLVLHNPNAGRDDTDGEQLLKHMEQSGHTVEVHTSTKAWTAALDRSPDIVAAIGGDGTVGTVARALAGRSIPIALLPIGTANNVAVTLGLTDVDLPRLIAGWSSAARQPFDMGLARGPWGEFRFLESVGVGVLSKTIEAIDEGDAGYVNEIGEPQARLDAALEVFRHTLHDIPAAWVDVLVDGEDLSGRYVLVEALNFGAAGPNLNFVPQGDAADGLLDLVLAQEVDRHMLGERLDQFTSDLTSGPPLRTHRGRRIALRCEGCLLHLDDELRHSEQGVTVTIELMVETDALTFLVPSSSRPFTKA